MQATPPGVKSRRWTKAEFYQLAEQGFFHGQKVELLRGRLMVQSPQNPFHASRIDHLGDVLRELFGPGVRIRSQLPLDLGPSSEPEPDFAVVPGTPQQYQHAHPKGALLIVEVADSSLSYDRGRKGSLYARSGIADYWVVNLIEQKLEIYRDPVADTAEPYGWRYSTRTDLGPNDSVSPLTAPGQSVPVSGLLG